ncbi:MAG: hypothetical protein K8T90_18625 [Planctomycetes bacterium]|nr:hypothetical protein [Planctomycetota bacterium]
MADVDAAIVFLPRFTTLAGATSFATQPMDVSAYGGVQFQLWRGPFRTKSPSPAAKLTAYLEESLDTETWVLGPSAPGPHVIGQAEIKFFSYDFRLRWFRLRIAVEGDEPMVTCWAEGLLRSGGGGVWPTLGGAPAGEVIDIGRGIPQNTWNVDNWLAWRNYDQELQQWNSVGRVLGNTRPQPPSVPRPLEPR